MKRYAFYNTHKVAYSITEQKNTTLVLIHGFCEDSSLWETTVQALQKDFCIICVDLSGFGDSDLLPKTTMETMAESIKTILEQEQIAQVVLVGHSLGGYVALAFAELYPASVLGIGLFHSHVYADSLEKQKNRQKSIQFIQRHGVAPFVAQLIPSLFAKEFAKANRNLVEELISKESEHQPDAVIAASQAMLERKDKSEVLKAAEYPVLFIIGKRDQIIPIEQNLAQTALPKVAMIHILPTVGHLGMYENLSDTVQILQSFIIFCINKKAHVVA